MKNYQNSLIASVVSSLLAVTLTQNASAATITWNGSTDSNWNTASNWNGGVPTSADTVQFLTTANNFNVTINTHTDIANTLQFDSSKQYQVTIPINQGLTVNNLIVAPNSATPVFNNTWDFFIIGNGIQGKVIINNVDNPQLSILYFQNQASAGEAEINNGLKSFTFFRDQATADNAVINNNGDSAQIIFENQSQAGNATLINNNSSASILFNEDSSVTTIGDPNIISNAGTVVFGSSLNGKTLNFASLSGNGGEIKIGNITLQVGDGNTNTIFNGVISGNNGNFTKTGTGTLTLNGVNTYTGNTTIQQGALMIGDANHTNASITSNVNIQTAGTLEGYGTVNGNVTNAGTISPGDANTIAKFTINGNYTQTAGSVFLAQNDAQGNSDQLVVNGQANLNGTLNVSSLSNFAVNQHYTFLTASSINGQFNKVVSDSPFFVANVAYNTAPTAPASIAYTINYDPAAIHQATQTHNQIAVANNIIASGANGMINGAMNGTTSNAQFSSLMDQLSGATYANQTLALAEIGNWFDTQLDNHDSTISLLPANDPKLWVSTQTGYNQLADSSDVSGLITHLHGVAIGSDFALSKQTTVGAALGLTNFNETAMDQEIASVDGNLYQLGAYIHHAIKNWRLGAELSYGFTDSVDTKRTIQTAFGNAMTTGNYHANVWSARGDVGYMIPLPSANYHVQPFAGVVGQRVNQNNFTENSNTGFELSVNPDAYQSLRSQLGVSADAAPFVNTDIKLFTNVSWEHEFADTRGEFNANFIGMNGSFNVVGINIGRNAAVIQTGIKLPLYNNKFNMAASYQGRLANNLRENLALLQFGYNL